MSFNFKLPSMLVFLVFQESGLVKVVLPLKIYQYTKYHGPTLTGEVLYAAQKFEHPPFGMV
jgi:hypothetical protein